MRVAKIAAVWLVVVLSGAMQLVPDGAAVAAVSRACCAARSACSCATSHASRQRGGLAATACARHAAKTSAATQRPPAPCAVDCVRGSCGVPESLRVAVHVTFDSFTLPDALVLPRVETSCDVFGAELAPCSASRGPETPPPRAA